MKKENSHTFVPLRRPLESHACLAVLKISFSYTGSNKLKVWGFFYEDVFFSSFTIYFKSNKSYFVELPARQEVQ